MSIDGIYQKIILDHCQSPRNHEVLPSPTHHSCADNPLCGDRVTLYLDIQDEIIRRASFQADGCALARASASMLTTIIENLNTREIELLIQRVSLEFSKEVTRFEDRMEPLKAFQEIPHTSSRRLCVTLAWKALEAAMKHESNITINPSKESNDG